MSARRAAFRQSGRRAEPERRSPWKDNAGDWGAAGGAIAFKRRHLNDIAACAKLLASRGQEPTAEAVIAWFQRDGAAPRNGYTLADVREYLDELN
jgi:hypothetical protein